MVAVVNGNKYGGLPSVLRIEQQCMECCRIQALVRDCSFHLWDQVA